MLSRQMWLEDIKLTNNSKTFLWSWSILPPFIESNQKILNSLGQMAAKVQCLQQIKQNTNVEANK